MGAFSTTAAQPLQGCSSRRVHSATRDTLRQGYPSAHPCEYSEYLMLDSTHCAEARLP
jgi:hypothetical protein